MVMPQDIRDRANLPEWWAKNAEHWRNIPFSWKKWDKFRDEWSHNHCEYCHACICNHRDRFPDVDLSERGCYRHAYYAEHPDGTYIWVCRTCFKRVHAEFGFQLADEEQS